MLKYAAKMHQVEVAWRLRNTRQVVIGLAPKLVLALRARRLVVLKLLKVEYPDLRVTEGVAHAVLAQVPYVTGKRQLKPEGEPWVIGQEEVAEGDPLLDRIGPVSEERWHGGLVQALLANDNAHPNDYWAFGGRVVVPKGCSVGLIVSATVPTVCRAKFAGE